MKRVIITGPTGVLGSALTKKMIQEGIETYVICHPGSKRTATILHHPLVHKIECDLSDIRALPDLIDSPCDVFFHFAWMGTLDHNNRFDMYLQNTNVRYALDAVEAAHELQCNVFIGAGSQAEYGKVTGVIHPDTEAHPVSGYGIAKLCAGQMTRITCQRYGIRHIWPRIVSVYGPHDGSQTLINWLIDHLQKREKPSLTAGEQIWDYLYSDDAADAFYQMALHGKAGSVYVLGSGQTKRLYEYMEIIRDIIDPQRPLGLGELPYYPDQAMHLEADIASLTEDTGWKPKTSFESGIAALLRTRKGI